ncbi:gluconate:H+ symporter [uncultured Megasphaera sp.]|uniref:gluconate:H+ symporter n=1 Tax=uncultured Megasphaera sp. TaxID=165188 RepID=UPI002596353F|nr:gluconate:H+ symporter [uncultured Megasphaera sp.]
MSLAIVALGVVALLVMLVYLKFDAFISLILVSIGVGLLEGMDISKVTVSVYNGIGGQLKSLILVIAFGAMLGRLLSDSGAAQRISTTMIKTFGMNNLQWAMMLTAFIIGVTMFFEAALIVMIPIIYTVVIDTKKSLMYVGLPAVIALSITHGFLPPHPGPAAVCDAYGALMGKTLLYGLVLALPIAAFITWLFKRLPYVERINCTIPEGMTTPKIFTDDEMPSFGVSILCALLPIFLMAIATVFDLMFPKNLPFMKVINFFGGAPIALLCSVLLGSYLLGIRRGHTTEAVVKSLKDSVKSVAMIILIIAAGGAFKQVIVDSGVATVVKDTMQGLNVSPLIMAWSIAAALRLSVGSATVSVMTASGLIAPIIPDCGVSVELMVLATACGSAWTSHVNDAGFWLYKEYYNLSVIDAIKTRSVYTTILGLMGLGGCMLLNALGF